MLWQSRPSAHGPAAAAADAATAAVAAAEEAEGGHVSGRERGSKTESPERRVETAVVCGLRLGARGRRVRGPVPARPLALLPARPVPAVADAASTATPSACEG